MTLKPKREQMLSYDWLRMHGSNPRMHGNRFLQIQISSDERVHLWSDLLPRAQSTPTPIHDHVHDFTSTVLAGELLQVRYRPTEVLAVGLHSSLLYRTYAAETRRDTDTQLVPFEPTKQYLLTDRKAQIIQLGDSYGMHAGEFHASAYVGIAVTYWCRRTPSIPWMLPPRVLVPVEKFPDNAFDRYSYGAERLWNLVEEILSCL